MTESSLRAQKLPVLEVEDLAVSLPPGGDRPNAVEHVSFTVNEGEVTCLIGESGSGKSVVASTVMGLLPKGLAPAAGSVKLLGMDLFRRTPDEIRRLRGAKMAMVFQEPMTALNPVMTCGDQMDELLRAHVPMGRMNAASAFLTSSRRCGFRIRREFSAHIRISFRADSASAL